MNDFDTDCNCHADRPADARRLGAGDCAGKKLLWRLILSVIMSRSSTNPGYASGISSFCRRYFLYEGNSRDFRPSTRKPGAQIGLVGFMSFGIVHQPLTLTVLNPSEVSGRPRSCPFARPAGCVPVRDTLPRQHHSRPRTCLLPRIQPAGRRGS